VPTCGGAFQYGSRDAFDHAELEDLKAGKNCYFGESTLKTFEEFGEAVVHCLRLTPEGIKAWYEKADRTFIRDDPGYLKKWRRERLREGNEEIVKLWEEVHGKPI